MGQVYKYSSKVEEIASRPRAEIILEQSSTRLALDYLNSLIRQRLTSDLWNENSLQEKIRSQLHNLITYLITSPVLSQQEKDEVLHHAKKDLNSNN